MSTAFSLLGLLERRPRTVTSFKRAFDQRFGTDKPLPFGQVYATLGRSRARRPGGRRRHRGRRGPERKRYAITEQGVTDLERGWPSPRCPSRTCRRSCSPRWCSPCCPGRRRRLPRRAAGRPPGPMRGLTELRRPSPLAQALLADYALFHLEADLRWLELTAARLDDLAEEVRSR